MKLISIANKLNSLGFFKKFFFASQSIKALKKFYKKCYLADSNLDRELTSIEYSLLHKKCLWKYSLKDHIDQELIVSLQDEECMRLGVYAKQKLKEVADANCLSQEVLAKLAQINEQNATVLISRIILALPPNLWKAANFDKIRFNFQENISVRLILNMMSKGITKQESLDLLLSKSCAMLDSINALRKLFLFDFRISEKELLFFGKNCALFQNKAVMAILKQHRTCISSDAPWAINPLTHIIHTAINAAEQTKIKNNPQKELLGSSAALNSSLPVNQYSFFSACPSCETTKVWVQLISDANLTCFGV